jgi:hypothetical protein
MHVARNEMKTVNYYYSQFHTASSSKHGMFIGIIIIIIIIIITITITITIVFTIILVVHHRKQYRLRKYLKFAKCQTCTTLRDEREKTRDENVLSIKRKKWRDHIAFVKQERRAYYRFRDLGRADDPEWLSITVDGSEQKAWGLPHFAQASKDDEKRVKLKVHLTAALVHGHGSFVYTTYEDVAHDANLTVEVLMRTLKHLDAKQSTLPRKLHIQLDNCKRENKNQYVYAWCCWIITRGVFDEIQVSFLPIGNNRSSHSSLCSIVHHTVCVRM